MCIVTSSINGVTSATWQALSMCVEMNIKLTEYEGAARWSASGSRGVQTGDTSWRAVARVYSDVGCSRTAPGKRHRYVSQNIDLGVWLMDPIATRLVEMAIEAMIERKADEVGPGSLYA